MPLTDQEIKKIKPEAKPQKLFDGGGLFLLVTPQGGKCWRMKYRFTGKEKLLSLGTYPEVTLKDARSRREEARKQLAQGVDPSATKRIEKIKAKVQAGDTFDALADEFLAVKGPALAVTTIAKKKEIFKNNLRPWLGTRPVKEITAPELLPPVLKLGQRCARRRMGELRRWLADPVNYRALDKAEFDANGEQQKAKAQASNEAR